jgi:MFS family permease
MGIFSRQNNGEDAFAVLKIRDFRLFVFSRFMLTFGIQMQSVIVSWQIYDITKDALSLGMIGLAEAVPFIAIALFGGYTADFINRRKIVLTATSLYLLCAISLFLLTYKFSFVLSLSGTFPIFIIIFFTGIARGFVYPSMLALMSQIVPRKLYANSSTWNSMIWQIAAVSGAASGGIVYGFLGINTAYLIVGICIFTSIILFSALKKYPKPLIEKAESIFHSLSEGIRFVFKNQIILGAMALDMFAVLFGGAVALLPIFADEILKTGPQGLGLLRAAPAFGAVFMSVYLAYNPPHSGTGKKLLLSVAGFGICIILFAISKNFYLSLFLLILSGAVDNVSVVVRGTIMQLFTPDIMRGRVASINSIFIGSSNEIGSFESGLAAKIMGVIPSVIFGGSMTLVIVSFTGKFAPLLRKLNLRNYY